MPANRLKSRIWSYCGAIGIWIASAGLAQAIIYKGVIDPTFHATDTGLTGSEMGWSAEIVFELDGCPPDLLVPESCTTMDLLTATGTLYDKDDPSTPVSTPASLDFLPSGPNSALINNVVFSSDGSILGLNTNPIGFAFATTDPAYLLNGSANLWLQFFAQAPVITLASFDGPPATGGYLIVTNPCTFSEGGSSCPDPSTGVFSDTAQVQFEPIPEPGVAWLILSAMVAVQLTYRRRIRSDDLLGSSARH